MCVLIFVADYMKVKDASENSNETLSLEKSPGQPSTPGIFGNYVMPYV